MTIGLDLQEKYDMKNINERESIKVLEEAKQLQIRKSLDYQNPNSNITQAEYYPRGLNTILDTIHGKVLRVRSLIESYDANPDAQFESIEDSFLDIINYASFGIAYSRGKMTGQDPNKDILNRPIEQPQINAAMNMIQDEI